VHTESVAFVHVRLLTQLGTGEHGRQTFGETVLSRKYPDAHEVHVESVAVWQVSAEVQWSTGVH
jgi:hypothetical protein